MKCNHEWHACNKLIAYDGEVVLKCEVCGAEYYNAQEFFDKDVLNIMMQDENIPMGYAEQLISEWNSERKEL